MRPRPSAAAARRSLVAWRRETILRLAYLTPPLQWRCPLRSPLAVASPDAEWAETEMPWYVALKVVDPNAITWQVVEHRYATEDEAWDAARSLQRDPPDLSQLAHAGPPVWETTVVEADNGEAAIRKARGGAP